MKCLIRQLVIVTISFVLIVSFSSFNALAQGSSAVNPEVGNRSAKSNVSDKGPIRISSNKMVAMDKQNQVVFSGNVVARRGDMTIYSDKLTVVYKRLKKSRMARHGTANRSTQNNLRKIQKIIAVGNVRVTGNNTIATAKCATYIRSRDILVLEGNATVQRGKSRIQGDTITIYINEDRSVAESGKNHRVEATIYPGS